MKYLTVAGKHRAVARAVPSAGCIIPGDGAAFVRARRGKRVRLAVERFEHREFFFSTLDDATLPRWNRVEASHLRLRISAFVEMLGHLSRRIVKRGPGIFSALNPIGYRHSRRGSVADAPGVEAGRHVQTGRLRHNFADKWHAIGRVVVLVDPVPGDIARWNMAANPLFELSKSPCDVAVLSGLELGAENDEQRAFGIASMRKECVG